MLAILLFNLIKTDRRVVFSRDSFINFVRLVYPSSFRARGAVAVARCCCSCRSFAAAGFRSLLFFLLPSPSFLLPLLLPPPVKPIRPSPSLLLPSLQIHPPFPFLAAARRFPTADNCTLVSILS